MTMKTLFYILLFSVTICSAQKKLDNNSVHGTLVMQPDENSSVDNTQIIAAKKEPLPPIAPKDNNPNHIQKPFSMVNDNGLMDAGEALEKSWHDGYIKASYYLNQNLGTFGTKGTFLNIECRDFGAIDGDRVRIMVNGVLIVSNQFLSRNYTGIKVNLVTGENIIEFTAISIGTLAPNTAQFRILAEDGNIITSQVWNLMTDVTAKIVIIKK